MMKKRDYRPKIHFSPEKGWMNDPNGMVYVDGVYHFFYQKYPYDTSWGPMHWGHATSRDLIHWEHQPIALYPDELGFIFSGSAVYDTQNSSEYGTNENPPIIAIYTSHHKDGLEQQSIAYSNDKGRHFEKSYLNPGIPIHPSHGFLPVRILQFSPSFSYPGMRRRRHGPALQEQDSGIF